MSIHTDAVGLDSLLVSVFVRMYTRWVAFLSGRGSYGDELDVAAKSASNWTESTKLVAVQ